jgi:hypothetical protein
MERGESRRRRHKLTTGIIASIWHPDAAEAKEAAAAFRLMELENHITEARRVLRILERKVEKSIRQLEQHARHEQIHSQKEESKSPKLTLKRRQKNPKKR